MVLLLSLAVLSVFSSIYYVWYRVFSWQGYPKNIAFAGSDSSLLGRGRASLRSVFGVDGLLWAGHSEQSRKGLPYILPDIFTGHQVILPTTQLPWLLKQPATVLSQREGNNEFLAADHTFLKCVAAEDSEWTFVVNSIKDTTKELNNKTSPLIDEIQNALSDVFGDDTQGWKEVDLLEGLLVVVSRMVSRVYVGLPLCRDPVYIESTTKFAKLILFEALAIQLTPKIVRPFLGPVVAAYDWIQYKRMASRITPIIRERVSNLSPATTAYSDEKTSLEEPKDLLQRFIKEAYKRGDDPCAIESHTTKLLAILNWAAIHVQTITIENAVIDIAHSPDSLDIQRQLREEATAVSVSEPVSERWKRAEVAKLLKMDSVMTESLRLWGFAHGVIKVVVAKGGVDLPSGEHIPYGGKVGVGSYGVHHDDAIYPGDPFSFDPFRFSKGKDEEDKLSGLSFATTSENYLAFSHGRYSCAGRFFANHLLKLLLAQIVMRYDIKPDAATRPHNPWVSYVSPPPLGYKLNVRRRQASVE